MQTILISLTLFLGVLMTVLSVAGCFEHGCNLYLALLTSSLVNFYCTYLCWDGLTNDTSECNTWNSAADTAVNIAAGLIVLVIALGYVSLKEQDEKKSDEMQSAAQPILAKEEDGEKVAFKEEVDESYGQNFVYFHGFMLFSSFYLTMLLTNWGSANVTNNVSKTYGQ